MRLKHLLAAIVAVGALAAASPAANAATLSATRLGNTTITASASGSRIVCTDSSLAGTGTSPNFTVSSLTFTGCRAYLFGSLDLGTTNVVASASTASFSGSTSSVTNVSATATVTATGCVLYVSGSVTGGYSGGLATFSNASGLRVTRQSASGCLGSNVGNAPFTASYGVRII